ncbi:MAG: T9SS type A sorting domain-containing protein [Flavobacteriales bacterium]
MRQIFKIAISSIITLSQILTSAQNRNPFLLNANQSSNQKIEYIPNQGQWADSILCIARIGGNGMAWVVSDGIIFDFEHPSDVRKKHDAIVNNQTISIRHHAWKMKFLNGDVQQTSHQDVANHYYNYFIGNDQLKWKGNVNPVYRFTCHDVWQGVDIVLYSEEGNFKYDLKLKRAELAEHIKFEMIGVNSITSIERGLIYSTSISDFLDKSPVAFQREKPVATDFEMNGNIISFNVVGAEAMLPLVIDPMLIGATLISSITASYDVTASQAQHLNNNQVLLTGNSYGENAPITLGSFDTSFAGGVHDIFISVFNEDCSALNFCTYLGGSSNDALFRIEIAQDNSFYFSGSAISTQFPTTTFAFDAFLSGVTDVFIAHLSADGTELLESTFIGSSSFEPYRNALAISTGGYTPTGSGLDFAGTNLYGLAGSLGNWPSNYPPNYFTYHNLSSSTNTIDFHVFKMNDTLSTVEWVTRIGGSGSENTCDLKVLTNGNIAIFGSTSSTDMLMTADAYQSTQAGMNDGYIAILSPDGSQILRSTYLGGVGEDEIQYLDEDSEGRLWFCGVSNSELPAFGEGYINAGSWTYIACMDSTLQTLYHYHPVGAGTGNDNILWPSAFMVDVCDRIYLTSDCVQLGLTDVPLTTDALYTEGGFYAAVYEPEMAALIYGSYMQGDHRHGGDNKYNRKGIVYQAVCSHISQNIILPASAYSSEQVSTYEGSAWVIDFESPSVISQFSYALPATICVPYEIHFQNYSDSAAYSWNFGDGSGWQSNNATNVWHEFNTPGNYYVQLAATNTESCNYSDTTGWWIDIPTAASSLVNETNITTTDLCTLPIDATLEYTGSGADSFGWYYNEVQISADSTLFFTASQMQDYELWLVATDDECNYSDTIIHTITPLPAAVALFVVDDTLLTAINTATTYQWLLNGEPIEGATLMQYDAEETGMYSLIVTNEFGCSDVSEQQLIEVGISELHSTNDIISLYPNPTNGMLQITFATAAQRHITIYDAQGKMVMDVGIHATRRISVDCNTLAAGSYNLRCTDEVGNTATGSFVKR